MKSIKQNKNLSLNRAVALRGFAVARELGYDASSFVEKILELLHEERKRMKKRERGDHLQITLFDRVTEPEPAATPAPVERKRK